jgi:hypothetical protein
MKWRVTGMKRVVVEIEAATADEAIAKAGLIGPGSVREAKPKPARPPYRRRTAR